MIMPGPLSQDESTFNYLNLRCSHGRHWWTVKGHLGRTNRRSAKFNLKYNHHTLTLSLTHMVSGLPQPATLTGLRQTRTGLQSSLFS